MRILLIPAFALLAMQSARAAPVPALELQGVGVQIYACTVTPAGAAWKLKAPEATLKDVAGRISVHHFAGPSWQAPDGSKITGKVLSASPAPAAGAIPWLIVKATPDAAPGLLSHVGYVLRIATHGGAAPGAGCDAAHALTDVKVPYEASYVFLTPGS